MSSYTVTVGSFEGPFDLLLQLIARRKVDIHEIPLSEITDDYLAVLRGMESVDLDTTTEFLVVASTLVEMKAARLLPTADESELDDLGLEGRDLLYARLLEYRTFKEASSWIAEQLSLLRGYLPRTAGPDPVFRHLRPPLHLDVCADDLARIAAQALAEQPVPQVDVAHLQPVRMTVLDAADLVMGELARARGRASFRELTAGCRHRIEAIVCFLALLELYKFEHVDLHQAGSFGDLAVEAVDPAGWFAHRSAGMGLQTSVADDVLAGSAPGDTDQRRGADTADAAWEPSSARADHGG